MDSRKQTEHKAAKPYWLDRLNGYHALVVAGILFLAWLAWPSLAWHLSQNQDKEHWQTAGQYSDSYGGFNALFSGLAFLGVMIALALQMKELRETQQDLTDARRLARAERFEAAFFQMLSLFNQIIEEFGRFERKGVDQSSTIVRISGRESLVALARGLIDAYQEQSKGKSAPEKRAIAAKLYSNAYAARETELAHYFRYLYRLLKWIESAEPENQRLYAKTLRAQLSAQEVAMLFFNSLRPENSKMRLFVEKFCLLKHLPRRDVFGSDEQEWFNRSAFTESEDSSA